MAETTPKARKTRSSDREANYYSFRIGDCEAAMRTRAEQGEELDLYERAFLGLQSAPSGTRNQELHDALVRHFRLRAAMEAAYALLKPLRPEVEKWATRNDHESYGRRHADLELDQVHPDDRPELKGIIAAMCAKRTASPAPASAPSSDDEPSMENFEKLMKMAESGALAPKG